ncbi:hypothetical protein BD779DRAFT_1797943 [Infundibulicybe gibba]|nr:hypothetical protein BD779DRAFT_1797943 [Infundibulicybe gibba]
MRLRERRKFRTTSQLYSKTVLLNALRLLWSVCLIWGELGTFFWSLSSCRWPDAQLRDKRASTRKPTHILLLSDTQVQNPRSNLSWRQILHRHIFSLNLRKNWHVTLKLKPHSVIFLGDMLAKGKDVLDEIEYQEYAQVFKSMFLTNPEVSTTFIPGNNDVGMGISLAISKNVRAHYIRAFGPSNQEITIRNHTFICLDAPGLVDEDYQRSARGKDFEDWTPVDGGPVQFVQGIEKSTNPRILLSHIPLARPDISSCGPRRERGSIRQGVGHGYQNTLGKQTSAFLLRSVQPSIIFSGDNRDYCDYTHARKSPNKIREVTVKSFSMSHHIRKPGFQLLSLSDPSPSVKSFADTPCLLPDQSGIYYSLYFPVLILTTVILIFFNASKWRRLQVPNMTSVAVSPSSPRGSLLLRTNSGVWSTNTPDIPASPRGTLPILRTPKLSAGPTLRAASRPATPRGGAPLLSPILYEQDDEEEDSMSPTHYMIPDIGNRNQEDEWSSREDENSDEEGQFVSAPPLRPRAQMGWTWTWTFVFSGRRRRMAVRIPAVKNITQCFDNRKADLSLKRRGVLECTLLDLFNVLWPPVLAASIMTWITFY